MSFACRSYLNGCYLLGVLANLNDDHLRVLKASQDCGILRDAGSAARKWFFYAAGAANDPVKSAGFRSKSLQEQVILRNIVVCDVGGKPIRYKRAQPDCWLLRTAWWCPPGCYLQV